MRSFIVMGLVGLLVLLLYTVSIRPINAAEVILVLGDSLSAAHGIKTEQGWVALLETRLKARSTRHGISWQLVNASVSGETTAGGLARLPRLLAQHQPSLCIIELGANDGLRGLNLGIMQKQIGQLITLCKEDARVLLLGMKLPPNYGADYTNAFEKSFSTLAAKYDVALVPFLLEGVALDRNAMQADGVHPTAAAQPRLLENVWPALLPLLIKGSSD